MSQTNTSQQPVLLTLMLQPQSNPQTTSKQYTLVTWTNPTISNINVSEDLNITLNGNLNITETGELHLIHCILNVNNGTSPVQCGVTVYGGMYINKSSTITALNSSNPYYFTVYEGATFQMNNSRVEYCGHSSGSWPNQRGLVVRADSAWIENNTITQGTIGLILYGSQGSRVLNNNATNSVNGFDLESSSYNIFSGNMANNNTNVGFLLHSSSDNNNFSGNNATSNEFGFDLESSSNNNLSGNTAIDNDYSFLLYSSSNNNNLTGNTAIDNLWGGFWLYQSSNNVLSGNTAIDNNYSGFSLFSSSNNNLSGNTAINSNYSGFYLYQGSNNNNLSGNTAINSNSYGFYMITSCTGNNILGNIALNITSNQGYYLSDPTCINNNFTGSVEKYYLHINGISVLGYPIAGADVEVETDGTQIYATAHFGGTNDTTDTNGLTPWIAVPYRTFTTNDTMTENITTAEVYLIGFSFLNNPRIVNMSTSHVEIFQAEDNTDPTVNIIVPPHGGSVNTGIVWIYGTFNGTGSRVMGITINETRFDMVEPGGAGPYVVTGTFSFRASISQEGDFYVNVTVYDEAGHRETMIRYFSVMEQPSEGPSLLPAVFFAFMLGTQAGFVSPLVYAAGGFAAGMAVVAAVSFLYIRKLTAG